MLNTFFLGGGMFCLETVSFEAMQANRSVNFVISNQVHATLSILSPETCKGLLMGMLKY